MIVLGEAAHSRQGNLDFFRGIDDSRREAKIGRRIGRDRRDNLVLLVAFKALDRHAPKGPTVRPDGPCIPYLHRDQRAP
jgi:hypothetical protein